jgi:hypothetical protein
VSIGPVQYMIIGFPSNDFDGSIVPALEQLVESGTVRIIDMIFIAKDAAGDMLAFEYEDHPELAAYGSVSDDLHGLLNDEDIELAAETLAPNSSAALIVWEDCWATPLAEAIRAAGGVIIAGERIPHQIVTEAIAAVGQA